MKIKRGIWQAFARRSKRRTSNPRSKDASGSLGPRRTKVPGANRGNGFALFDFGHFLTPSHCLFRMTFGSRKLVVLRPPWDSFTSGSLFLFRATGCFSLRVIFRYGVFFATGFGSIRTGVRGARRAPRPPRQPELRFQEPKAESVRFGRSIVSQDPCRCTG